MNSSNVSDHRPPLAIKKRTPFWGLFRRRRCVVPTWRGWLFLAIALTGTAALAVRCVFPFLSVSNPVPGGILVMEGWAPDYALAEGITEFRRHRYERFFVTGVPIERGAPFTEHQTYAEFGAAIIRRIDPDISRFVTAVPAPLVRQDRTYTSAVALKKWSAEQGRMPDKITIFSLGPHARRTRLLYEKAFGKKAKIGVIAGEDQSFDPHRWWASSPGVRTVVGELVAYVYTRFFFWPPTE